MSEALLILIFVCIILIVVKHFNTKIFDINNKLVKLECDSHNNTSNVNNIIDIIEENRVERLKKSKDIKEEIFDKKNSFIT